jgi:heptosyltransferase-3
MTRRLGDVLLVTPLIRSIKQAWPRAAVDVLAIEGTEGFLLSNPDVSQLIIVPQKPGWWRHFRLLARLLRRYDLAVSALPSDRAVLYAWLAGKLRIAPLDPAKAQRWKQSLLSAWAPFDNMATHTVRMNLQLAKLLGITPVGEVVVSWTVGDEASLQQKLPDNWLSLPFAVLHVFPKFPYKMWHASGWRALARWLVDQGIRVVLTGSAAPDEMAYVENVYKDLPKSALNLSGQLSLPENAYLVSRTRLYVGPDTALTHMAAALGVPTVALYGPSNPVKWSPWPKDFAPDTNPFGMRGAQRVGNVMLVQGEGLCVPCFEEGCERHVGSFSDCLQHLSPRLVIDAVQAMLRETVSDQLPRLP